MFIFFIRVIWFNKCLPPQTHEIWMRLVAIFFVVAFGALAQFLSVRRRRAEEAIKQTYLELDQIFNTAADGMCLIDKNSKVFKINDTFSDLTGFSRNEAVGEKCYEIVPGPECHTPDCCLTRILGGEELCEVDMEKKRADGAIISCLVTATPFRGTDGRLLGIVEDFKNITERKQSEEELKKYRLHLEETVKDRTTELSAANKRLQQEIAERIRAEGVMKEGEERFRIAAERASDLIYEWDILSGGMRWFDDVDERLGYVRGEFPRKIESWKKTIHPEDCDRVMSAIERHLKTREPYNEEYRVVRKDGEVLHWRDCGTALWDEKGRPYKWIGVNTDITLQRRMETSLRKSENLYRTLFEDARDAVFIADTKTGLIISANRQAERLLNRPRKKIIGLNQSQIYPPDKADRYLQLFKESVKGIIVQPIRAEVVTGDGRMVPVEINSTIIDMPGGEKMYQTFFRDITERKKAEKAIGNKTADLDRRVRELNCLYAISHLSEKKGAPLEEILQGIVDLIPSTWPHPESICARIIIEDQEFKTNNFKETTDQMAENIFIREDRIGAVEVFGLEEKAQSDETAFTEEQKNLIYAVAERSGKIIQHYRAEEALRASESKLSAILESISDHMSMMDEELNIIWANETAREIFGDNIIGTKCYETYHRRKEPCEPYPCLTLKAFRDGKTHQHETQIIDKNGKILYYHCIANVVSRDKKGKPTAVIEISRDFTERKEAEKTLLESEERFRSAFNSAAVGMVLARPDGRFIKVNQALYHIFGYSEKELLAKTFGDILHPDDAEKNSDYFNRMLSGEIRDSLLERRGFHRDGHVIWVLLSLSLLRDSEGRPIYFIAQLVDISTRKFAEEEVIKTMKIKSGFISMVSHELRTPLTTIKEGINIVSDELVGGLNNRQKAILETSRKHVDRLARLINEVLDFQKLESGQLEWNIQANDINEVVWEIYNSMFPMVKEKKLDFTVKCEKNLPKTQFDKDKIIQVLINLVNNAVKFTEKGGITVTTERQEDGILVMVRDTGPGIKKEDMPKLFESFQQLGSPKERKGGTGLGLSICKKIIMHHKGQIWASSEFGRGTVFYFVLPIRKKGGYYG